MLEKDITLAMGIVLRDLLAANPNYRVRLTRDQDVFLRLRERYRFAQDHAADLFISLHADSLPGQKVRGASVYVLSEDASDAEADALAVKENASDLVAGFELAGDVNDVGSILIDLSMRENQSLSNRFANQLVASLRQETDLLNRPKRSAGFAVLKSHDVPSVLLEMGYLSDADDAALLIQGEYRRRLAHAIVHAIEQYFAGPGVLAQR
jgi:N-acetylmuramoyl-L-alanine amidase